MPLKAVGPMQIKPRAITCIIFPLILALVAAGCSRYTRKSPDALDSAALAEVQTLLSTLSNQNKTLKNFKGIGHIKARQDGKIKIDERIAWVGSETAKLNIAILVSGHPAIKIASDGKWFYYYEVRGGEPFYKKISATDANLKRIIAIPINTTDVINLLAGRVPLRDHHSAMLEPQSSGDGFVLVLKRRWWGVIEKIYFDQTKSQVQKAEFYDRTGSLVYTARFDEMQIIKGYQVPARLSLTNGEGVDIQLMVNRYWTDVVVSSSMFVLNPPE
jgi:hypothetical protein